MLCREPLVIERTELFPLPVLFAVGYISNTLFDYFDEQFYKQYDSIFASTCSQKSLISYNRILSVTSGKRLNSNKEHDKFLLQSMNKSSLPRQRALHIAFTLYLMLSLV